MTRERPVRRPEDLAETAEAEARVRGVSVNQVGLDALLTGIEQVRQDEHFVTLAHTLLERDKEILDRLAE